MFGSVAVLHAVAGPPRQPAQARSVGPTVPVATDLAAGSQRVTPEVRSTSPRSVSPRPTSLRIAAIGVRAEVESLHLDRAGRLQPPRVPSRAGWWSGGPVPGDLGAAVLAGHLDSLTGPALFWRLAQLRTGDVVRVTRSDGRTVAFAVDRVQVFAATAFPTQLVYGPTPDRELRLVTCGGSYDYARGHYRDNVVVFALAIPPSHSVGQ